MGEIKQEIIEVSVSGGCNEVRCENYSHSYDYEVGEDAVLFLQRGEDGIYYALNSSFDAFTVDEDNYLTRKTDPMVYPAERKRVNENISSEKLNISSLKSEIKELLNHIGSDSF